MLPLRDVCNKRILDGDGKIMVVDLIARTRTHTLLNMTHLHPKRLIPHRHTNRYGLKYINLSHAPSNNNHDYSLRPHYVNECREPDGAAPSLSAFFPHSTGLDSEAGLLTSDTMRGMCLCDV